MTESYHVRPAKPRPLLEGRSGVKPMEEVINERAMGKSDHVRRNLNHHRSTRICVDVDVRVMSMKSVRANFK